jgi:Sulfotransferase family
MMLNFRATALLSAGFTHGLQNYPLSGRWLDDREQQLETQWHYYPHCPTDPIFIVGTPQSGGDALYRLLVQHCPEMAYFAQGQLSVVDHYLLSDLWCDTLGLWTDPLAPAAGIHEFLTMFNHPLIQGRYGLEVTEAFLAGKEEVVLSRHQELSSFIQQLNSRLQDGSPATFLNSYHVAKFKEALAKSVFTWQRRKRPVQYFLGAIPSSALTPRLLQYLFPTVKLIHIARQPQTGLAAFVGGARELPEIPMGNRPNTSANVLASYYGMTARALQRELLTDTIPVLHLTYEALQENPGAVYQRLTEFLAIAPHPALSEALEQQFPVTKLPESNQRIEELIATYTPEAQDLWQTTHSKFESLC